MNSISCRWRLSCCRRILTRHLRPGKLSSKLIIDSSLREPDIPSEFANEGIEFSFVPPYTPHFNGIAEAAVKSTKHHLKRLLQQTHFTYEELATCLTQIEAVLNSRPLTPLSSDPHDFSVLTPAHFLIGRSLTSVPQARAPDGNITSLQRYQRVARIKDHFWTRFQLEYISTLQKKTKWHTSHGAISVGTLVLIRDKDVPPLCWLLGRVVHLHPGADGVTRVADINTRKGIIRRAFNAICPLPIEDTSRRGACSRP
ncbi:uncharacterized protein LOC121740272 [Aricia agestis]|uniref:uncharacterized protein LOC121740272 n=1 Tax=Aricia agestis TaxID=91739 RepID=UPI001C20568B|nr:uncharacterized protein LOC121740272 [Aricia agestis]